MDSYEFVPMDTYVSFLLEKLQIITVFEVVEDMEKNMNKSCSFQPIL